MRHAVNHDTRELVLSDVTLFACEYKFQLH